MDDGYPPSYAALKDQNNALLKCQGNLNLRVWELERERDAAREEAAKHERAVEKLAERLASRENGCDECYADPPGNPECCKQAAIAYAYAPATAQDAPHNNTAAKETPQCEHQEPDAQ